MIRINHLRWFVRWPIKWAIFGLAYVIVCFPYPRLFVRHLVRWSNPAVLVDPSEPALQPWIEELSTRLPVGPPSWDTLNFVERYVYQKVPYEWDWNTWGMADYIPSAAEVVQKGREDCDGRAVVAASMLERIGVSARLVTDFTHVWVASDLGQAMGPRPYKAIEVTDEGMKFDARGLREVPRALAYGISVFPLFRELILMVVVWLLLLGPRSSLPIAVASFALLTAGLLSARAGAVNPQVPLTWLAWIGLASLMAGVMLPLLVRKPSPANEEIHDQETNSDKCL